MVSNALLLHVCAVPCLVMWATRTLVRRSVWGVTHAGLQRSMPCDPAVYSVDWLIKPIYTGVAAYLVETTCDTSPPDDELERFLFVFRVMYVVIVAAMVMWPEFTFKAWQLQTSAVLAVVMAGVMGIMAGCAFVFSPAAGVLIIICAAWQTLIAVYAMDAAVHNANPPPTGRWARGAQPPQKRE